jgi:hypothetical protein
MYVVRQDVAEVREVVTDTKTARLVSSRAVEVM